MLLIIYPYKFTNFEHYKLEIGKFKFDTCILDLSYSNQYFTKNSWKSSRHPKAFAPKNIISLYKFLNPILKRKPIILNYSQNERNLWVLLIKFLIKKK